MSQIEAGASVLLLLAVSCREVEEAPTINPEVASSSAPSEATGASLSVIASSSPSATATSHAPVAPTPPPCAWSQISPRMAAFKEAWDYPESRVLDGQRGVPTGVLKVVLRPGGDVEGLARSVNARASSAGPTPERYFSLSFDSPEASVAGIRTVMCNRDVLFIGIVTIWRDPRIDRPPEQRWDP